MIRGRIAVPLGAAFVLFWSTASSAQTAPEVHGSPPPAASADVLFDADISIRSIRYDVIPKNAHLTVSGVNQQGGTRIVRTTLPAHPQAGKTYRNVRVQVQAASRFVDPRSATSPAPAQPQR